MGFEVDPKVSRPLTGRIQDKCSSEGWRLLACGCHTLNVVLLGLEGDLTWAELVAIAVRTANRC